MRRITSEKNYGLLEERASARRRTLLDMYVYRRNHFNVLSAHMCKLSVMFKLSVLSAFCVQHFSYNQHMFIKNYEHTFISNQRVFGPLCSRQARLRTVVCTSCAGGRQNACVGTRAESQHRERTRGSVWKACVCVLAARSYT